jgi:uncharacterized protein
MRKRRDPDIEIEIPRSPERGLALDKRSYSPDGWLQVTDCVISAAQVNPYQGREVPDYHVLGLDPDRIYQLYREPAALKAAVPLFNGIPLLADHAPVSADDPKQQLIVGTVGDCRWDSGRVMGTISVWVAYSIRGIEQNIQRDLSAGYHYRPVKQAGVAPGGERYEIVMRDIVPQHVALVAVGRVTGAMVADAALDSRTVVERMIPHFFRL